ncbi:MAG: nucleotidyltransferase domain-containing protein [Methanomicrobiales archaeon]|jgi:predicted nucleotidyltransferase|nr:nucleotidyltransferase domain-containing protein [Methanomicrobiales archaeon]
MKASTELQKITQQFIVRYQPHKLLLFGSHAKDSARQDSDIDLCVIVEVTGKRILLTDMYLNIESDVPFDLLLYSPEEWEQCILDHTSFAYQIHKEGVLLYG